MVKAAAQAGFIDEARIVMENMYAFARAGSSIIITYHCKDIVQHNWM
jgi:porphobilinogen synthase